MPSRTGPRSVKDATRFTSTVLHATSKTAGAAMPTPQSRIPDETPEQRVRRLRLAHLAAQKSQVSRTDRIIGGTRMLLDVAHQWTIRGIVLFTGKALSEPPLKAARRGCRGADGGRRAQPWLAW